MAQLAVNKILGSWYALVNKSEFVKKLRQSKYLLMLFSPCLLYYVIFKYVPMWGALISFKNYKVFKGFWESKWVGFDNYIHMFESLDLWNLLRNTFLVGFFTLICGFPIPIILALVLNEVRNRRIKRFVQTVSYLPYFMSMVIIVSMLYMFMNPRNGIVNNVIASLGYEKINFFLKPEWFRPLYVIAEVWQKTGWDAIIYLAALTGVDIQLYESAVLDGANKWKQLIYITIPCIMPVIIITLLLSTGFIVDIGFEKAYLMQYPANYSTSDVLSTYVYRQGMLSGNLSYGAAFGTLNSVINLFFILISNRLASRYSETSLW